MVTCFHGAAHLATSISRGETSFSIAGAGVSAVGERTIEIVDLVLPRPVNEMV